MLKTQIFAKKRQTFHWRKDFGPIFPVLSNITKVTKPFFSVTSYSALYCGTHRSIFWDLRGCWRHKVFNKMSNFPLKKRFWPKFSPIIEHDKYHGTLYKGPQDNLASIVQMIRSYFAKKEVDRNKRLKKKPFSQWQKFLAHFS